ncbi:hypothetical protein EDI_066100 [Entamoeba dispar SAW760]|uniref:Uncharacterized protein n=1 Tax=Entamoeba dispar (strain ATCC PRA-260 / SAW760) TaxID=370354 RepID=B0EUM6_ENTDS|nr:uncharacterized protein EDI_066100 [Entamoeba dispar SAW760]EDR21765.1 hypothetical protein EDI_066100 [Entamoeba dispar SAW760]|eukprot:EDR21765.1 hypothetical protein EDI_066100 [Entamoeba dispar SAW760]
MSSTTTKPLLSILLSTIAKEVRVQLSQAIDETTQIVLYGLVYWFRIWDHEHNLKYSKEVFDWLDFLLIDIESNLIDSTTLIQLLKYIRSGCYIPDTEHFN